MIASRLVAYQPNGARIGVLPDPASWSGHMPVNGVSALTLAYFGGSDGSDALADPVEVALEVSNGGPWAEPANARFLRMVRDRDQVDKSDLWKFSMPGYAHLLKGACVLAAKTPSEANTDKDGKRKFLSANAGTIVKTVLDEARALDPRVLEGLTIDFTTSRDSAGALWSKVITIYYEPGMGLETILDNLAAQGVVDWQLQGRTLQLFNPDTVLARKLPAVRIHDQDSEQAPIKGTLEGLRHLVLLQGDEGKLWTKENITAPTPWGKSITFITQGGVRDEGTAATLIQAELDAGSRERVQYTRALTLTEHTPTPFVDYRPGDFIQAHDAAGAWASLRVFALGMGRENGVHKVTLTLGDLFEDALIRQAKRTKGIVGGASAEGGSGARPAPPEPGVRKPMAPAGLVMNSDHYFDARGVAHASVLATYAPATHGVDGLGLTIQAHELFGRQVGSTDPYRMLTSVEGETATIGFSPLPVQVHWDFKVRAIAENGVPSDFSDVVRLELARDVTPPPPPSEPYLTTRQGTVTVTWDGKTDLGTDMPADFDYCAVEVTNHGGTGFIAVGEVRLSTGLTQLVIADLPYNVATQVHLVAVDSSGNRSEPSEIATITTKPLVDADLIETTVFEAMNQLEIDLAEGMDSVQAGIDAVEGTANQASAAALAAQAQADVASTAAATAADAAATADSKAVNAAADAAAAAGIANGKGKVLVQPSAPGAADRNANTLWIDTTGGANTPKRWVSGTTWEAVTDKAATDAATAAANAASAAGAASSAAAAAQTKADAAAIAAATADGKATTAQAAAGVAQTKADNAASAAATAQSTATAAQTAAGSAQSAADAAKADALAAAGLAGSKGEVIYQASAPTGSRANAANLWIRTSDNRPHTYNGTSWVAVTDKAATDAATAAGNAQTAANTAKTAADAADAKAVAAKAAADAADAKAVAAQSAAGTAQSAADAAMIAAGTKSNIYYSTAVATGTGARVDDIWRQRNTNNEIIGEWRWSGTAWQKITLTNGVFSNLDAGLMTLGVLHVDRIAAASITAVKIAAYTITAMEIATDAITAAKIFAGAVTTVKIDALAVTAAKIATNAITADKILAGAVTTVKLVANAIDATRLDALAITSKHTITGATIQTTATALRGVKINGSGLFAYNTAGEQTVSIYGASGNATVTGTIQTGLGSNQVVMDDNISRGRPGIRMYTGANDGHHPVLQAMGTGANDGFPSGATLLLGAETTLNSSGRADLVLKRGGDFELKQNWGVHSGAGMLKDGGYLYLRGVIHQSTHARDMFVTLQGTAGNIPANGFSEWAFTHGQPAAFGTRKAIAGTTAGGHGKLSTNMAVMTASATTVKVWNLNTAAQNGVTPHVIAYNSY